MKIKKEKFSEMFPNLAEEITKDSCKTKISSVRSDASTAAISDGVVYVTEAFGYATAFGVPEYYQLSINSPFGNTNGADFYPVNSTAQISVDSPLNISDM